jgi:lysophospholipase L1-like esterase
MLGLALWVLAIAGGGKAVLAAPKPCKAPGDLVNFREPLPATTMALMRKPMIRIVALGSSSTEGSGASGVNATYPARFDAELDHRFPGRNVQVLNFGKGGQLATDMLARITADVLPAQPTLVIWQTGVNDAIDGVPIDQFRQTLANGIRILLDSSIDVVLIDMQFYPRSERVAGYGSYVRAMREAAGQFKIPLLRRYAIMKYLIKSRQFTTEQLLASDAFHLNDLSYGCLATLLADAVENTVKSSARYISHLSVEPDYPVP